MFCKIEFDEWLERFRSSRPGRAISLYDAWLAGRGGNESPDEEYVVGNITTEQISMIYAKLDQIEKLSVDIREILREGN